MKRLVSILIICLMLFALCSCARQEQDADAEAASPAPTAAPSPTEKGDEADPGRTAAPAMTAAPAETAAPSEAATPAPVVTENPTRTTPESTLSPEESPFPSETEEIIDAGNLPVTYSGETVDCSALSVGDRLEWTLSLSSENSGLCSGLWLIDYPEEYLSPVGYSVDWEGSLSQSIFTSHDSGAADSDIPVFACSPRYEGQTGENPYGEAGNMYSLLMMYLATFEHGGVQAKGPMVQIVFELTALPADNELIFDSDGGFISMGVTVLESMAMLPSLEGHPHDPVLINDGKLYFSH